jgi:hypothetical protein
MEQVEGSSSERGISCHAFLDNDSSLARIVAAFLHQGFDGGSPGDQAGMP